MPSVNKTKRQLGNLMSTKLTFRRAAAAVAGTALLAAGVSACGGGDDKSSAPKPVASIVDLHGDSTAIKLDAGFASALQTLKLTPSMSGDGTLVDGSVVFPITGGNVTVFKPGAVSPYVIGQIQHVGSGLVLTGGDTAVTLSNFNVDPGVSRVYGDVSVNGQVAATDAFLFQLDGRTLKPLQTKGADAILTGTKVEISPVAAPLLDQTFGTTAVKAGLLVGIATITVNTTPGK
jgi:hypothetical protein